MRHPAVDFSKQGPLVLTNKRALLSKAHAQTGVLETTDLRRRVKQRELPCTDGEHLEAIAAINKERNIVSIFVGQVWNRARLQSRERSGFFPLVRDVDVWPLQDHFNGILKETADSIGVSNFIPPIDEFEDDDFADKGHFSAKGAAKFALMITPIVKSSCK